MYIRVIRVFIVLLACLFLHSCSESYYMFRLKLDAKILDWRSKRYANKMEKKNHVKVDDYYRFYDRDFIVDTLQFKNPVVVDLNDYEFICEDSVLKTKGKIESVFYDSDIYRYNYDFGYILPLQEYFMLLKKDENKSRLRECSRKIDKYNEIVYYKFEEKPDKYYLIIGPVGSFKGHVDRITYYHGKTKENGKVKKRPARDTYRNNKAYRKRKRPPYIENAYVRAVFCVWNSQKSTKEAEK